MYLMTPGFALALLDDVVAVIPDPVKTGKVPLTPGKR